MIKILFIATGFAPYSFSENIVNSKLVLAFLDAGWKVDVISRKDEGPTYSDRWDNEWSELQGITHEVTYPIGNKLERVLDTASSTLSMGFFIEGVRWAKRAYEKALKLHKINKYNVVISRSPTDISHLVAYHFSKKTGAKWIANWNDPATTIWPEPYTHIMPVWKKKLYEKYTANILRNADINTFPSEDLRNYFMKFFPAISNLNSEVIPHIGFQSIVKREKKEHNTFKMCHAGNLSKERNPERFFHALKQFAQENPHANIEVDLMGVSDHGLENLVEMYELEEIVNLVGSFPYMEALSHMSDYDVLLIIEAELKDAIFLPSKLTDYSRLGVPIFAITSKQSCISKLIDRYGGGICADGSSIDKIYRGINYLYEDWKNDRIIQKHNTNNLYDIFEPKNIIEKYKKIFQELNV